MQTNDVEIGSVFVGGKLIFVSGISQRERELYGLLLEDVEGIFIPSGHCISAVTKRKIHEDEPRIAIGTLKKWDCYSVEDLYLSGILKKSELGFNTFIDFIRIYSEQTDSNELRALLLMLTFQDLNVPDISDTSPKELQIIPPIVKSK